MEAKDQDLLLNYEEKSRIELLQAFYLRGYDKTAAVEKLVMSRIPHEKWKGSVKGVTLICLGVCYILIARSSGDFHFEIDSTGDLRRLNEWVLKPFILINFFLLGALLLKNRENFPFKLKVFYLVVIGLSGFFEALNNYLFNVLVAGAAFYAIFSIKEKSKKILMSSNANIADLEGSADEKAYMLIEKGFIAQDIEDILMSNYWRGILIFPLFIAVSILFFSARIDSAGPFTTENYHQYVLTTRIIFGLFVLTLTAGLLLGINEKLVPKIARFVLAGIFAVAACWIFLSFGFQIMGTLLLIVAVASLLIALKPIPQKQN